MAGHHPIIGKKAFKASESTSRRRVTDNPQPLDYVTKSLVRDIIESQPRRSPPLKSFIQKLLKLN